MNETTTPLVQLVFEQVAQTVETVRIANGYHFDAEVVRPSQELPTLRDGVVAMDPQDPQPEDVANILKHWIHPIWCLCFIRPEDGSDRSVDELSHVYRADIERALMANWHMNGLCYDGRIGSPEYEGKVGGEGSSGLRRIGVQFLAYYRHEEANPYEPYGGL
jgi:hypothetical protein